jgi:nicotinate-nucleotide pyrophosphorylase (carboxylating)
VPPYFERRSRIVRERVRAVPARSPPASGEGSAPSPPSRDIDRLLTEALREDRAGQDRTSLALFPRPRAAVAYVLAQREGIVSGLAAASRIGPRTGLRIRALRADGARIRPGDRVLELRGDLRSILAVERTVLNLVMHLSGVATATREAVDAARGRFSIYGTRKTLPGLRALEKNAIVHGGGRPHRADLASGILVKSNHLAFVPIPVAVERLRRAYGPRVPIEVEVRGRAEALEALDAGADALLIDNAPPARARSILRAVRGHPRGERAWVELSGGLTPRNLSRYRGVGADAASLGALTHSSVALPFHLRFLPPKGTARRPARRGRRA